MKNEKDICSKCCASIYGKTSLTHIYFGPNLCQIKNDHVPLLDTLSPASVWSFVFVLCVHGFSSGIKIIFHTLRISRLATR